MHKRSKIYIVVLYRVVCPNFGHPALISSFYRFKHLCCRHATKMLDHHSKAETIPKQTLLSHLSKNIFHRQKIIFCK